MCRRKQAQMKLGMSKSGSLSILFVQLQRHSAGLQWLSMLNSSIWSIPEAVLAAEISTDRVTPMFLGGLQVMVVIKQQEL